MVDPPLKVFDRAQAPSGCWTRSPSLLDRWVNPRPSKTQNSAGGIGVLGKLMPMGYIRAESAASIFVYLGSVCYLTGSGLR